MFCSTHDKFSGFFDIDDSLILGFVGCLEEFKNRIKSDQGLDKESKEVSFEYRIIDDKKVDYQIDTSDELIDFIRNKRILITQIRLGSYTLDGKNKLRIFIGKNPKGAFEIDYELRSEEDIVFLLQRQLVDIVEKSRKEDIFFKAYSHKVLPKAGFWLTIVVFALYFLKETQEIPITSLSISDIVGPLVAGAVLGLVPGAVLSTILEKANFFVGRMLFPEDTLNMASGETRWQNARKLKTNLFWGVFVAALVTLVVPLIFS